MQAAVGAEGTVDAPQEAVGRGALCRQREGTVAGRAQLAHGGVEQAGVSAGENQDEMTRCPGQRSDQVARGEGGVDHDTLPDRHGQEYRLLHRLADEHAQRRVGGPLGAFPYREP